MILYYSPGTCALGPHVALREADLPFTLERVDLKTHQFSGGDFAAVNPKRQVPTLRLADGEVVTEGGVILRHLADASPPGVLAPTSGTPDRRRVDEWLNFIATELHKGFTPLFHAGDMVASPECVTELRRTTRSSLEASFAFAANHLGEFIGGDHFTIADCYLLVVLRWARAMKLALAPKYDGYFERLRARPSVAASFAAEGLTR